MPCHVHQHVFFQLQRIASRSRSTEFVSIIASTNLVKDRTLVKDRNSLVKDRRTSSRTEPIWSRTASDSHNCMQCGVHFIPFMSFNTKALKAPAFFCIASF